MSSKPGHSVPSRYFENQLGSLDEDAELLKRVKECLADPPEGFPDNISDDILTAMATCILCDIHSYIWQQDHAAKKKEQTILSQYHQVLEQADILCAKTKENVCSHNSEYPRCMTVKINHGDGTKLEIHDAFVHKHEKWILVISEHHRPLVYHIDDLNSWQEC